MADGKEIKLKVAEAIQDDVNKGIVRIDSGFMQEAGIRPGDVVEIRGERKTVAIADRAYPGDIGLNIIRMDGIVRRNSKTGIGELIKVTKAEVKEAKKVIIAPARKGVTVRASSDIFKQGLLGRAVVKGDIVALGGTKRRRSSVMDNPFFEDVFNVLDENMLGFGFGDLKFLVADTNPKQAAVIITDDTDLIFNPEAIEVEEYEAVPEIAYEDIGGLDEEIKKIREMVELPLKHPEVFERLGIEPPKGVLLHGPPGTGKTLLAKAVANETNSHFLVINGPEIMSKYYGQSEENIRKKFEEAEKNSPSIIFIDEIDAIASKREETRGEVERRVVAQMLALMDGLKSRGKVVVIAATNVPNILDPALRRPGRFDREVEIRVPSKEGREAILKIHTRNMPLYSSEQAIRDLKSVDNEYKRALFEIAGQISENMTKKALENTIQEYLKDHPEKNTIFKDIDSEQLFKYIKKINSNPNLVNLDEISNITYGFVGADLASLAKEAAMIVLRRVLPELKLEEEEAIPNELLDQLRITKKDFYEALKVVRPSALREVLIEVPDIKWDDIGGLEAMKQELKEAVEWPLENPDSFSRMGIKPPKGVLLYGAPGTGKTLLAKAVAAESNSNFIRVKGPELLSKWVGESEKAVREIFKKARQTAPTIIFFDEIDSLAPRRGMSGESHVAERVVNQLLTEIDGLEEMHDVVIIAATNRPDIVDPALLRPGRFDRVILVPAPDEKSRLEIFKVHTKDMPLQVTKDEKKKINEQKNLLELASKIFGEEKKYKEIYEKMPDKDKLLFYLAAKTQGYAGADIENLCREAAIIALRKDLKAKEVTMENFEEAMKKVPPSVTSDIEKSYEQLKNLLSSAQAKQMKEERPAYMG
ncbi:CDC48 family AAA ATPase [Candidatus Woesearchaeota archaeon]|nr:CDC48 family AAA ATPase [Candidatus Woesearchaeota archaeon]